MEGPKREPELLMLGSVHAAAVLLYGSMAGYVLLAVATGAAVSSGAAGRGAPCISSTVRWPWRPHSFKTVCGAWMAGLGSR